MGGGGSSGKPLNVDHIWQGRGSVVDRSRMNDKIFANLFVISRPHSGNSEIRVQKEHLLHLFIHLA